MTEQYMADEVRWRWNDDYAEIYEALTSFPPCNADFDRSVYKAWLDNWMQRLDLAINEVEDLAREWATFNNAHNKRPKVVKGSFREWMKAYVKTRDSK